MSPKKKKRPVAAQQLIDSLLDDKKASSSEDTSSGMTSSSNDFSLDLENTPTPTPVKSNTKNVVFDPKADFNEFSLEETSQKFGLDPVARAHLLAKESEQSDSTEPLPQATASKKTSSGRMQEKVIDLTSGEGFEQTQSRVSAPPFEGDQPLVTKLVSVPKPEPKPAPAPEPRAEKKSRPPEPKPLPQEDFGGGEEKTIRLEAAVSMPAIEPLEVAIDSGAATEIRTGIRTPPPPSSASSVVFASSDAALKQSESLRIAQSRISSLESEIERLRRDNESLATAGDTLRRRADELMARTENLDIQYKEAQKIFDEEKKVLRGQAQTKERENSDLRARLEELELRLESNFKKIRVRERELEHRLEITKLESATLVSSKDKMILELKRQIDQLGNENDYAKVKTQELFNQYKDKQETVRRVVRALRIALTILEGDEDNVVPLKKAE